MRIFKAAISMVFFLFFSTSVYSQLWKQYADSANTYTYNKNTDKTIEFYTKVKEALQKDSAGTNTYARICDSLGISFYQKKQYAEAEKNFLEEKGIREKLLGKLHPDYVQSCYRLARFYSNTGKYEQAEPLYLELKQIQETLVGKEHTDYANCCYNLGILYHNMGQYEKAAPQYLEAKQIRGRLLGKEHHDYASCCNLLATIYYFLGQYEKAEPLYLEAKQIREKLFGKQHVEYAQSCNDLGVLYRFMGQYEKAEMLCLEAMQIQEKLFGKNNRDYARSCDNLEVLYQLMGQYEKAEPLCIEAKQILENLFGKEDLQYGDCCLNLACLYWYLKEYKKAEPLFVEAKEIKEKALGKDHPAYALTCNDLAQLYRNEGQYEKAVMLYQEAKQIWEKNLGKLHPDYSLSCKNLGTIYRLLNKPLLAEKEFKELFAVNSYNLNAVFQFTNEKEKASFIKNILGEDDEAYSFYASGKPGSELPYSLSLFHRNLILSSSQALQKQVFYSNDTALTNKYNEWTGLKKHLSVLYSKPVSERKDDITRIEENAEQLEKELTGLSAGFKKQQEITGWKDIQNKLLEHEASIEFVEFKYHNGKQYTDSTYYIALVLRKDRSMPVLIRLFEKKQLDSLLVNTGNKTTNDGVTKLYASRGIIVEGNNNPAANRSVYSLVWKPLEKELKGITTIYFAPSGMLHRISFAALPVNKNEVLSDKYKLVQLASTASVINQTPTFISPTDNLQFYGGINYDADSTALKQSVQLYANNIQKENSRSVPEDLTRSGTFNYLAGTDVEIKTIGEEAKKTQNHISLLSGINATEESFKALNGKASPAVIHIATHGFFFPDPKAEQKKDIQLTGEVFRQSDNPLFRSGLLFAGANNAWQGKPVDGIEDGILTAYEVSNMYLPNTKLAVLSACETALGDIQGSEGVYGLQRAFKIAGVQNLVMSLWKVPDAETAEFMQLFYKNMFAKESISDAFYDAQTTMKNKYRSDPYKWAAWILVR